MGLFERFRTKSPENQKKFGFAVVGLGHIAKPFLEQIQDSLTCRVSAVVSGNAAKADAAKKRFGIETSYTYSEFDRIAENADVDAVYLALPVSLHREYTERAAAAGKHVLCEKPMASSSADAEAMIAACRSAGVRLGIAYRCPHTMPHKHMRHLIQTGVLGPLSSVQIESGFGFELKPGWRDTGALAGGGSLWDVGIYPLNAARFFFGEEPVGVEDASAVLDANGMEQEITWTSVFPCGARARCSSSYMREIYDALKITGEFGRAMMTPAFRWQVPYRIRGSVHNPIYKRAMEIKVRDLNDRIEFRLEAEELAAAVREVRDTICPGEDGLADLRAMEAIYRAAGVSV